MAKIIEIDPITRVEGHLGVKVEVENGVVKDAHCSGPMFRGFEEFLKGRKPFDATRITMRICGVCPISHSRASTKAIENAWKAKVPPNAELIRNVLLGTNTVASHATHIYVLWGPDLINQKYANHPAYPELKKRFAPFTGTSYKRAVLARKALHEIVAIFGGKFPHPMSLVPGGITRVPQLIDTTKAIAILLEAQDFVEQVILGGSAERWLENKSLADVQKWMGEGEHANSDLGLLIKYGPELGLDKIGAGCGKFVAYGIYVEPDGRTWFKPGYFDGKLHEFDQKKIEEHVKYSWFKDYEGGKHPSQGVTEPEYGKEGAYSYLKSPRYGGNVAEVGALARQICDRDPLVLDLAKNLGPNVYTRMLARAHEAVRVFVKIKEWLNALDLKGPGYIKPKEVDGSGFGLTEAPRGALGHWIEIKKGKVSRYQIITPTAWNASPRDFNDTPGPIEQAMIGTPVSDPKNPIELYHVIRSFDPCLACAVHVIEGNKSFSFKVIDHVH